jgi:DNA-binding NtrC family response regulator
VTSMPALLGNSPAIGVVREEIALAARTRAKVLIVGETGTGKELVARLVHQHSAERGHPFVPINCSGVPETLLESELFGHTRGSFTGATRDKAGLVQQADGGTLFLDELGEMSPRMQAVLLRFAETGEMQRLGGGSVRANVRLMTATHRNLRKDIADGTFREDLFYRLNVIQLEVPPLRKRGDDILLLLEHYLAQAAAASRTSVPTISTAAAEVLLAYEWPGNVRELRNVTERLALQAVDRPLTPDDLPVEIRHAHNARMAQAAAALTSDPAQGFAAEFPEQHDRVARIAARLRAGEDFWTVVQRPYKARDLNRADLIALIDMGLRETGGSYRALLEYFHLPPSEYKRFHAFLYQHRCNLPVAPYRKSRMLSAPVRHTRPVAAAL